jgi:phosphatidylinositol glycan class B
MATQLPEAGPRRGLVAEIVRAGGLDDPSWRRFLVRWLLVSLALVVVAAYCSEGFYHPDEQFQVLEFVGAKLGRTPWEALPWEFPARLRSWTQPAVYYAIQQSLSAAGVQSPFSWAFALRLFSGIVGWISLAALALLTRVWFTEDEIRRTVVRLLALCWFVPFLLVRTSGESLSTSCTILGLALVVLGERNRWPRSVLLAAGVCFGLAFDLRFASAVMSASVVAWAVVRGGLRPLRAGWIVTGALLALALGAAADRWGYGEWVFPAYHYVVENIWRGKAEQFGTEPWYGYLVMPLRHVLAPLILVQMAAMLVAFVRHPFHVLTWTAAPYLFVLSCLAHKELRFLFPVAVLGPVFVGLAVTLGDDRLGRRLRRLWERRQNPIGRGLFALNLAGLVAFSTLPCGLEIRFQRFVYDRMPDGLEAAVRTRRSPYLWGTGNHMYFYRPSRLVLQPPWAVDDDVAAGVHRFHVITPSFVDADTIAPGYECEPLYRSFPYWGGHFDWFGWQDRTMTWDLYRCRREDLPTRRRRGAS